VVAEHSRIILYYPPHRAHLHSHNWTYPREYPDGRISSAGQQVTLYSARHDENNYWIVHLNESLSDRHKNDPTIRNGDIIQLEHPATGGFLSTHDVASPSNPANMEMTVSHKDDSSTLWRLEIRKARKDAPWTILSSNFRLISVVHKVALHGTGNVLPAWAYGQLEVNGHKDIHRGDNQWIVVDNQNDEVSADFRRRSARLLKLPNFWQKFLELQEVMHRSNANLLDATHPYGSRPQAWAILRRGVSYWYDSKEPRRIYLLGNPLIWWMVLASLVILSVVWMADIVLVHRGQRGLFAPKGQREKFMLSSYFFGAGYFLHYAPFFTMARVLFMHHYLPALLFSFMLSGVLIDMFISWTYRALDRFLPRGKSSPHLHQMISYSLLVIIIAIWAFEFVRYAPLSYGLTATNEYLLSLKRVRFWDFVA
jgi:dolichyl-phosphate-mannose-protein mannosyltransferase